MFGTRRDGLFGLPTKIESPSDPATRAQKRAVKEWSEVSGIAVPESAQKEILKWVVLMGFCLCQVTWVDDPSKAARWVPCLEVWHPSGVWYDTFARKWKIISQEGQFDVTPGDGQWVLFSAASSQPFMDGAVRSLGIPVLIRSWSWCDWTNFTNTLGQGFLKIVIPSWAAKSDTDPNGTPSKDFFMELVRSIGRGNRYLPIEIGPDKVRYDAEYAIPPSEGHEAFERLQNVASIEITTRILGQNLTTEVKGGSYAATKEHGEVRQDIKEADSELLSNGIREGVIEPWAFYHYGDRSVAPWQTLDPTRPEDKKAFADTLVAVSNSVEKLSAGLSGSGVSLDVVTLYERFGIPLKSGEKEAEEPESESRSVRFLRVPWKFRKPTLIF